MNAFSAHNTAAERNDWTIEADTQALPQSTLHWIQSGNARGQNTNAVVIETMVNPIAAIGFARRRNRIEGLRRRRHAFMHVRRPSHAFDRAMHREDFRVVAANETCCRNLGPRGHRMTAMQMDDAGLGKTKACQFGDKLWS
jgi:hypothetical protein